MPPRTEVATRGNASAPLATLPAGFASLANQAPAAKATNAEYGAYLWFASSKSGQWADMKQRLEGLQEHDPVYVSQEHSEIVRVPKFHLINATQYWARKDPKTGQPASGVVYEAPATKSRDVEEYIDAVIMVQTAKGLLPCRARFKSGLVGAITPALRELETLRDDPESWASRSPAHAAAAKLAMPVPCFRFLVTPTFQVKMSKTGFPYLLGKATCTPVTPQDATLVVSAMSDPAVAALCDLVAKEHEARLAAVRSLPA